MSARESVDVIISWIASFMNIYLWTLEADTWGLSTLVPLDSTIPEWIAICFFEASWHFRFLFDTHFDIFRIVNIHIRTFKLPKKDGFQVVRSLNILWWWNKFGSSSLMNLTRNIVYNWSGMSKSFLTSFPCLIKIKFPLASWTYLFSNLVNNLLLVHSQVM